MRQTRLISVAVIYIEKFYANCILQVSMDRIIDIFGKKICFNYFVVYWVKKIGSIALIVF